LARRRRALSSRWRTRRCIGIRIAGDATLGLIGSSSGVVQIALKQPNEEGGMFLRHPRNIAVSLRDPSGFMSAVEARLPR